jgi:hypothetical protein
VRCWRSRPPWCFRLGYALDDKFALGTDALQWILYRRAAEVSDGTQLSLKDWRPVSFVSSTKAILLRIRVPRITGAFAAGHIVNPLTARSQLMGGMIYLRSFWLRNQKCFICYIFDNSFM